MKLNRRPSEALNIDISPLIDMVFILLIFFMVSTTFVKDMKVELERPGASSASAASDKSIKVFIDAAEKIYIDGNEVRPWVIQSIIRDQLAGDQKRPILVVTDKGVSSGKLIEVVDSCRMAGASDIGVATEGEGS